MSNQSLDDELVEVLARGVISTVRGNIAAHNGNVVELLLASQVFIKEVKGLFQACIPKPKEEPEDLTSHPENCTCHLYREGWNECVKEMEEALGE